MTTHRGDDALGFCALCPIADTEHVFVFLFPQVRQGVSHLRKLNRNLWILWKTQYPRLWNLWKTPRPPLLAFHAFGILGAREASVDKQCFRD